MVILACSTLDVLTFSILTLTIWNSLTIKYYNVIISSVNLIYIQLILVKTFNLNSKIVLINYNFNLWTYLAVSHILLFKIFIRWIIIIKLFSFSEFAQMLQCYICEKFVIISVSTNQYLRPKFSCGF